MSDELKSYSQTVEALRSQANQLSTEPGAPTSGPEVNERMSSIDKRYKELIELAKLRHQRLLDALSLYKLFSEADAVQQWIGEKVIILVDHVNSNGNQTNNINMKSFLLSTLRTVC